MHASDGPGKGFSLAAERNDQLLEALPVGVVIFPESGIQDNLADKASEMGIPVWDFRKSGYWMDCRKCTLVRRQGCR